MKPAYESSEMNVIVQNFDLLHQEVLKTISDNNKSRGKYSAG